MNVAFLDHEGPVAREDSLAGGPHGAEEITLSKKVESLRELAQALLKEVEQLEESLSAQGDVRGADLHTEVQRFETEIICRALKKTGGHQRRAARMLGVKVSTLNAKIKRYGILTDDALGGGSLRLVGDAERA